MTPHFFAGRPESDHLAKPFGILPGRLFGLGEVAKTVEITPVAASYRLNIGHGNGDC